MSIKPFSVFAWWSAATIFLSAFLLFQVQPVISKMILPWFGGGPAVWTVCMLFFQVGLLGGYAYAHLLAHRMRSPLPLLLHVGLLAAALLTLPITPDPSWKPGGEAHPTSWILLLLLANIGLPYFLLSTTGPLVQAWYSRALPGASPYRLYALSNVGSLGALLTYPFLFEPQLTTGAQGALWSVLFGVFAVSCGGLAMATYRIAGRDREAAEVARPEAGQTPDAADSLDVRLAWLLLPALASMMLLAVTNHVCQDIAVVPFLWVLPLSLYLLSFIICFDNTRWYRRRIFGFATVLAATALCFLLVEETLAGGLQTVSGWLAEPLERVHQPLASWLASLDFDYELDDVLDQLVVEAGVFLLILFLTCMVCHGELVRLKPPPRRLTSFYLMVAAGGALGGILVALVCPQVFSTHLELGLGLVAAFMLAMGVLWDDFWQGWFLNRTWKKGLAFSAGFLLLLLVVRAQFESLNSDALFSLRNFYGVLAIHEYYEDDPQNHIRELLNGRILHGAQFLDPDKSRRPITYYNEESGIGIALRHYNRGQPLRVGVVGLGTGTIAAYGRANDYYCFYEINPNVPQLAQQHFTYLRDTPAEVHVEMGDARVSLERHRESQQYDILALDAFSGDAIPAHLLTREAFEQYLKHLKPNGIVAVHISNRHLDLLPVVGGLAEEFGLPIIKIEYIDNDFVGEAGSDWVLLTRNQDFLEDPVVAEAGEDVIGYRRIPVWTDQYSNLLQIMHWR